MCRCDEPPERARKRAGMAGTGASFCDIQLERFSASHASSSSKLSKVRARGREGSGRWEAGASERARA